MGIQRQYIENLLTAYTKNNDFFVVDFKITPTNSITILLDHINGVTISDCVNLSRYIEEHLDREQHDFELHVSSPGLDEPLKLKQQFIKNKGRKLDVLLNNGQKIKGTLDDVTDKSITLSYKERIKEEGKKNKKTITQVNTFDFDQIKKAKVIISFNK
ncbi:MAG: ribosome assembly cofactor RimP [Bacteroidetes bacterium]|jgi:ribosome maturation factor RimP|nr:ribosome assembly cofactor RimP [Bacteroidota bacterium]